MGNSNGKTGDTRERILEAALNLFSENGFHASTTRAIAQRANVNEVTLFRLFKTKMDLFEEILRHVQKVGITSDRLIGLDLPPEESIRAVTLYLLETLEEHPREFRIMFHAVLDQVEGFEKEFVMKNLNPVLVFLREAFGQLQEQGRINKTKDPELLALFLLSGVIGLDTGRILLKSFTDDTIDRKTLSNQMVSYFID